MARIPKFVIRMADDYPANTLDELKEHFDINTIVECFHDRRLLRWLKARNLTDLAEQVGQISADDKSLAKKLCAIFGIIIDDPEPSPDQIIFEIMRRVKQHTADDNLIKQIKEELETGIANVAFEQTDLDDLVEDYNKIYLCSSQFVIPLDMENKKYIGVGDKAVAIIKSSEPVDFEALHISFEKIPFDDDYRKIIKPKPKPRAPHPTSPGKPDAKTIKPDAKTIATIYEDLHARLASAFVQKASQFKSDIRLEANEENVDAKSILMIMSLGLTYGTSVTLTAWGSDALEAVTELSNFIEAGCGEN